MKDSDMRPLLADWAEVNIDNLIAIREEMPVGSTRIDMTMFSTDIYGFEIKSDGDTLSRLQNQCISYELICDYSTVVITEKHKFKIMDAIPDSWGILLVKDKKLLQIRAPLKNKDTDILTLLHQNWKSEILYRLGQKGIKGISTQDKNTIVEAAQKVLSKKEIKEFTINNNLYKRVSKV